MKIVILSHSSELGGAERSMIDLFDHWTGESLIKPHFIIRKPLKSMVPELKKRNWPYDTLYYTNWSQRKPSKRAEDVFRNARYNAQAIKDIEKIIQRVRPDVVMTNTIVSPWAAIAAHFQRVPHVWFVREYGDIDHQHIFELGREKMLEDINTLSSLVVTNSKTLKEHIEQYIPADKIQPLYTPFDLEHLEKKAAEATKSPYKYNDSLKLVITGRIAPSKGQDLAAKAVGELKKQGFSAELCVIGTPADPDDRQVLNDVIKEYDIEDRVHIIGHQNNPLAIITHADIGIMASQQEAFGRVTFEYMATGKPVIGANSGATPELIDDGKNGYLFERGSVDSLLAKLRVYAKDMNLAHQHGENAKYKTAQMMKGQHNADALYEQIKKSLADKKSIVPPLNFSHKWIEYPLIAQQYIDESRVISLKRLLVSRLRGKAKSLYVRITTKLERSHD